MKNSKIPFTNVNKMLLIPPNFNISDQNKVLNQAFQANKVFHKLYDLEIAITPIIENLLKKGLLLSDKWLIDGLSDKKQELAQLEIQLGDLTGIPIAQIDKTVLHSYWKFKKLPIAYTKEDLSKYKHIHCTYYLTQEIYNLRDFLKRWESNLSENAERKGNLLHLKGSWMSFSAYSGRLSASKLPLISLPNIMNSYIIAPDNHIIISIDFSFAEIRSLAYLAECDRLINDISRGLDFHEQTGQMIYKTVGEGRALEKRALRDLAKGFNFSHFYGASDHTLREKLRTKFPNATTTGVQKIRELSNEMYPELEQFLSRQEDAEALLTPFGYVRPLTQFTKNQKRNHGFQGTVAVLIKILMIIIHEHFEVLHYKHDELWISVNIREPPKTVISKIEALFINQLHIIFPGFPVEKILSWKFIGGNNNAKQDN